MYIIILCTLVDRKSEDCQRCGLYVDDYDSMYKIHDVIFRPGATCASFNISVTDDNVSNNDKILNMSIIKLSLPYGVLLGELGSANVRIIDNEGEQLRM